MSISVVYIIYNMKVSKDIVFVLDSAKRQTAEPEILICEQNPEKTAWLEEYCHDTNICYFWEETKINVGNMGLLKNRCILSVKTRYIYFSDTDIIFLQPDYLEKLERYMELSGQTILVRAPMKRLIRGKEDLFKALDLNSPIRIENSLNRCFVYFVDGKIVGAEYERYKYINNLPHVQLEATGDWQLAYHSGGVAADTKRIRDVGGYSMDYYGWGMDDIDLQWKLNETFGARAIDDCVSGLSVLHIEHPSRCEEKRYQLNRTVFKDRVNRGLMNAIKEDIEKYEELS